MNDGLDTMSLLKIAQCEMCNNALFRRKYDMEGMSDEDFLNASIEANGWRDSTRCDLCEEGIPLLDENTQSVMADCRFD